MLRCSEVEEWWSEMLVNTHLQEHFVLVLIREATMHSHRLTEFHLRHEPLRMPDGIQGT